jgi:hypothetical protein
MVHDNVFGFQVLVDVLLLMKMLKTEKNGSNIKLSSLFANVTFLSHQTEKITSP